MDEYIKRKDAFEILQSSLDSISQMSYLDMDWHELDIMRNAVENAIDDIGEVPSADVQPVDRWISFKDKQPQEGGFYLTYYAEHIRVSQWFPSKNWYNEHGGNITNMVEYWQPLPEPPQD